MITANQLATLADTEAVLPKHVAPEGTPQDIIDHATRILREQINETIQRFTTGRSTKTEEFVVKKESKRRNKLVRLTIYGHPVTAIIRWMGTDGWTKEDAACCLAAFDGGADVSPATIATQLTAGKKGRRGQPAELTKHQISQLRGLIA